MNISNTGIELIKSFEGCPLVAYKDAVGVWTIGWGHTYGVYGGMVITQSQADAFLLDDIKGFEEHVNKYNETYHFNQNQFDALVSFAFNIGSIGQLTDYGRRTIETISEKIVLYDKADGQTLPGLTRRRKAEKELFDTPVSNKKNGWFKTNKGWTYYDNGKKLKAQWKSISNKEYYFDKSGIMACNEYIKSSGYDTNKKLYYVDMSGAWDGKVYKWILDVKGWWLGGIGTGWYPKEDWAMVDGKWYYFDKKGYMLSNTTKKINGKTYTFNKDGSLKV